jgi:hypothetical protein
MVATPSVKYDAPPTCPVSVNQIVELGLDTSLTKRGRNQIPLPGVISLRVQMLQDAAAANPEMPADRHNPLRARFFDLEEPSPVRLAGNGFYFDGFAWQRTGDVDRPFEALCNSVAALPETGDHEPLNHAGPR